MALLSCPFCRALYTKGEAKVCPECGVDLVPLQALPLSADAEAEDAEPPRLPEHEPLPWWFAGRGRAALFVLALLGLAAFFLPWVELTFPDHELRSGFDLARGRAGWLWGGAVGWFVLIPLVVTRRTIAAMRGVRPIAALFASLTLAEVASMLLMPPAPSRALPVAYGWAYGLYLSAALSAVATAVAVRFGGALPPLPAAEPQYDHELESSTERILH